MSLFCNFHLLNQLPLFLETLRDGKKKKKIQKPNSPIFVFPCLTTGASHTRAGVWGWRYLLCQSQSELFWRTLKYQPLSLLLLNSAVPWRWAGLTLASLGLGLAQEQHRWLGTCLSLWGLLGLALAFTATAKTESLLIVSCHTSNHMILYLFVKR